MEDWSVNKSPHRSTLASADLQETLHGWVLEVLLPFASPPTPPFLPVPHPCFSFFEKLHVFYIFSCIYSDEPCYQEKTSLCFVNTFLFQEAIGLTVISCCCTDDASSCWRLICSCFSMAVKAEAVHVFKFLVACRTSGDWQAAWAAGEPTSSFNIS